MREQGASSELVEEAKLTLETSPRHRLWNRCLMHLSQLPQLPPWGEISFIGSEVTVGESSPECVTLTGLCVLDGGGEHLSEPVGEPSALRKADCDV